MNYKEILENKMESIFHNEHFRAKVAKALQAYGKKKEEKQPDLVRLAILKNAGVDYKNIQDTIVVAKEDFRLILEQAQYPRQTANMDCRDIAQMEQFMEADRQEWDNFLKYQS